MRGAGVPRGRQGTQRRESSKTINHEAARCSSRAAVAGTDAGSPGSPERGPGPPWSSARGRQGRFLGKIQVALSEIRDERAHFARLSSRSGAGGGAEVVERHLEHLELRVEVLGELDPGDEAERALRGVGRHRHGPYALGGVARPCTGRVRLSRLGERPLHAMHVDGCGRSGAGLSGERGGATLMRGGAGDQPAARPATRQTDRKSVV